MGLFTKLFNKKSGPSANYQISCSALRLVFYSLEIPPQTFYNNLRCARALVATAISVCSKEGIKIPSNYNSLPITFVENADRSKYGYIVAFDDAKHECDCNFIAMMFINGKKAYYTNEYYASTHTYSLCMFTEDGSRYFGMGDPQTYEEFKRAILE